MSSKSPCLVHSVTAISCRLMPVGCAVPVRLRRAPPRGPRDARRPAVRRCAAALLGRRRCRAAARPAPFAARHRATSSTALRPSVIVDASGSPASLARRRTGRGRRRPGRRHERDHRRAEGRRADTRGRRGVGPGDERPPRCRPVPGPLARVPAARARRRPLGRDEGDGDGDARGDPASFCRGGRHRSGAATGARRSSPSCLRPLPGSGPKERPCSAPSSWAASNHRPAGLRTSSPPTA